MATSSENLFNASSVELGTVQIVFALVSDITLGQKKAIPNVMRFAITATISFSISR